MNKLVVKVAILTFLSLIAVSLISAFSIFTFAPGFAGDKCFELGLKNVATKCYERAYEQTGEFDDLVILVDNAIFSEDGDAVLTYWKSKKKSFLVKVVPHCSVISCFLLCIVNLSLSACFLIISRASRQNVTLF